ncbi:MAG: monovalent cation:proton antiporter-2 (CPA2) family protein [Candidatus Thiodiazotropha sp. (ex Codakia rugifera)]|nr:monovalent cation:proton antiporter-2 (CPA2) family protein [Candidatus Thiodiazotropha sp. (ex Codakia rugifera)]
MTETHFIIDILVLLAAAVLAVPLFQRLGLGAVLGFLVAGTLVGPWGLAYIVAVDEIRHLAEFGVVFLLFVIGIEMKPSRLWVMRRSVFGLGTAQVVVTGTVITLLAQALGMPTRSALIVGFGLALSSTAFGLQILSDKSQLGTAYGRTSFAILLLQDLAIVPLMALLPLLAQRELSITEDVELAALESVAIIIGVFILGRLLLRPALQIVARNRRNPEIFTATGIFLVLGAAWLTDWAGLSMALGAFLGGLLLADSHYRHQIMADIQPFRGLLLGLFFMSVGMSINFGLLGQQGLLVAGLVGGLLLLKATILWALCRITGRANKESVQVALLLAQAGEFGFILFGLANMLGVLDDDLFQLLLVTIALSMAATPLLTKLSEILGRTHTDATPAAPPSIKPIPVSRDHVIVAGFGRVGRSLARSLAKAKLPYLVLEVDPERVTRAQALDYPVFFGDASRIEILRAAGAAHASKVVFAMDHMESIGQGVVTVREAFPGLPVYARAWDASMAKRLTTLGVTFTVPETLASGQQLSREVLQASGVPVELTAQLIEDDQDWRHQKHTKFTVADKRAGFRDILLVMTPGIDELTTLEYAAALAEDSGAALTVAEILTEVSSSIEGSVSSPDELEQYMKEDRRIRLDALVARLHVELDIQTKVLVGRPHEEIVREVVANERDLVLKAAEGGEGLKERLFGGHDFRLLRACPCSVLLIRKIPPKPYRHRLICAGVYQDENPGGRRDDRYAINHKILEQATWITTSQFAELHIVHAWDAYGEQDMRSGRSYLNFDADNYVAGEQQRNRLALNSCLSELRESLVSDVLPAFKPECHLVKGNHRDEITKVATKLEADLVVVGDLANSGITQLIVDSTADAIIRKLSCSVLVVKPPNFVTPIVVDEH